MLGGSSVLRLVGLLWFSSTCAFTQDRTAYRGQWRNYFPARNSGRNALYSRYLRRNSSWNPKVNSMAFSYLRSNKWSKTRRRQDIYDGSDYDWVGFPVEDTPTSPPDYNSWPQTVTQASSQVVAPQLPQQVPTQPPLQAQQLGPYRVPPLVTNPIGAPKVVPQPRISLSTTQTQSVAPRINSYKDSKPSVSMEVRDALRVCSPGPPLGVNPLFRNCLIIGDSISLGYLTTVKGQLKGLCQVQHAPFAKGSGAVDSRYGLQCLSMMLSTTSLEPTHYDAVVFNFGMHDIDYSKLFPEEFVPLEEYGQNLRKIKNIILQRGAQVAFALTTPVPIAGRRNKRVIAYNKEAVRIMEEGPRVEIIDLHAAVIKVCGEPPYDTCSIMKQPRDVHFNPKGSHILGVRVGAAFRSLLSRAKPRGQLSPPKAPELSTREGLASAYLHDDTSFCPDMVTRCPARTTCCEDLLSLTGYGCCMAPDAARCPDSWHCCPRGSHCSTSCNFRSCRCIFPFAHPLSGKLTKEGARINVESKSESGIHPAGSEGTAQKAKAKNLMSMERKGKENKLKANRDNNQIKLHKKGEGKSEHIVKQKESKTERLKQRRKDKARKKTKKNTSKPHENRLSAHKLKKSRKVKTIQKISKKVVKAHRKHQKTRFHHKKKQHWINVFQYGFGALKKHKPHITFSHTWGKRKHQKLSFKSNRHNYKRPRIDISMTEELKHLIVNHRKEKLRARLRLRSDAPDKYSHGSEKNRHIQRTKSKKLKRWRGKKFNRVKIRRIFTQPKAKYHEKHRHHARTPSLRHKLKKDGKLRNFAKQNAEGNSRDGHLKGTLHSREWNTLNVNHLDENTSAHGATSFSESGKSNDSRILIQKATFKEKIPLGSYGEEQDIKLNLTNNICNSSSAHESASINENEHNYSLNVPPTHIAPQSDEDLQGFSAMRLPNVTTNCTGKIPDKGKPIRNSLTIFKAYPKHSSIEGSGQDGDRVRGSGEVANNATSNEGHSNKSSVKYTANTRNGGAFFTSGTGNKVWIDSISGFGANGLEADGSSFGSSSGLEESIPNSGDFDRPEFDAYGESSGDDPEKVIADGGLQRADGIKSSNKASSFGSNWNTPIILSGSSNGNTVENGGRREFGGEAEYVIERDVDKVITFSGDKEATYSGSAFYGGTNSFNQNNKAMANEQAIKQDGDDFFSTSTKYVFPQTTENDWSSGEAFSGSEPSSSHQSGTSGWESSGEDSSYSGHRPVVTRGISSVSVSAHQSEVDFDGKYDASGVANEEEVTRGKKSDIGGAVKNNQKNLVKTVRANHETNRSRTSWKDEDLQQLLYWLSTSEDDSHFKQTPSSTNLGPLHYVNQTESRYSHMRRLHEMLLQKVFPDFSKGNEQPNLEESEGEEKVNVK